MDRHSQTTTGVPGASVVSNRPVKMITKARLPITIRFARRTGYDTLQARVGVNGEEGGGFAVYSPEGQSLSVAGLDWNQKQQRAEGRSNEARTFNLKLNQVWTDINAVYDAQKGRGLVPTSKSVKEEYRTGVPYADYSASNVHQWSPLVCYRAYLKELESGGFPEKVLAGTTLNKWRYGLTYLETYVAQSEDPQSTGSANDLTLFWGKNYHHWLMKNGPMAADSATRYVNRLIEAITYVAEMGAIQHNPLANLKLSRAKTKDVYFLEPHHLERFWKLELKGRAGIACWWMGVVFLTGLDYPDAVRYVQNRELYERTTEWGKKIVILRDKPPKAICHIPISPLLEQLLKRVPEGPVLSNDQINTEMYAVATLVGFEHRLTCKVGRKTAGAIFYAEYEDIGAVSRMLGHSSIQITERYYVKTTGYTVDKTMQKRFVRPTADKPFTFSLAS